MYQKLIIVGNLGNDPELRYTPDGSAVANFSVAVNSRRGETESVIWFRVSVWNRLAETVDQYLSKGRKVLVEGVLQGDPTTGGPKTFTRRDGSTGASFEMTGFTVQFLGGGEDGVEGESFVDEDEDEDGIPF